MASPFAPPIIPGAQGYPLGLTGATAATRYVGGTTSSSPASGTFAVGDYVIGEDGTLYVCTVAGSPGTWTQVGSGGGASSLIGVKQYAPGTLQVKSVTGTTLTAFDTTNLTVSFTAPASGAVLVRFTAQMENTANAGATDNVCLFTHGSTTVVGTIWTTQTGQIGVGFTNTSTFAWYISGLTPAAALQYDIAGATGAGATVTIRCLGATAFSSTNGAPAVIEVWSA